MPQQDDGMEKRRQKREAQRKRRQAQVRRMRLTLALAAVLLIVCGVGIYKLTQSVDGGDSQPAQQVQTVPTTEETKETLPIQGGFILRSGNVEVNCTFDTLVRLQKAETAGAVAKKLFPEA